MHPSLPVHPNLCLRLHASPRPVVSPPNSTFPSWGTSLAQEWKPTQIAAGNNVRREGVIRGTQVPFPSLSLLFTPPVCQGNLSLGLVPLFHACVRCSPLY
eukprot:Hpha_TRINITY_DN15984_c2_g12::TRINITY_DN15984_c2_g12_i1::g.72900::m.72900